MRLLLPFFLVVLWVPRLAFGYAELVRYDYPNCRACHVSPDGGGLLTSYGRGLTEEILSMSAKENEGKFLYGVFNTPDWLLAGGDFQAIQTYTNYTTATKHVQEGKFIVMQADAEAAVSVQKFTFDATLGRQEPTSFNHAGGSIFSRRHYAMYQPTDELSFRVGKFLVPFGINMSDHTAVTKRGLNFDEGSEAYNLEAAWLGKSFDAFATITAGRPDSPDLDREKGFALRSSAFLKNSMKVGGSYYYGTNSEGRRHVFGPYGVIGLSPSFFILVEADLQDRLPTGVPGHWGFVNYLKADYMITQGLHFYLTEEYSKTDLSDPNSLINAYGAGVQIFPRPHFEFMAEWEKRRLLQRSDSYYDMAWLLAHIYL